MSDANTDWLTWLLNQGVAVAVLAFLLVRLEARLARLESQLQQLVDADAFARAVESKAPAPR
jgi:hypothetical protein